MSQAVLRSDKPELNHVAIDNKIMESFMTGLCVHK